MATRANPNHISHNLLNGLCRFYFFTGPRSSNITANKTHIEDHQLRYKGLDI